MVSIEFHYLWLWSCSVSWRVLPSCKAFKASTHWEAFTVKLFVVIHHHYWIFSFPYQYHSHYFFQLYLYLLPRLHLHVTLSLQVFQSFQCHTLFTNLSLLSMWGCFMIGLQATVLYCLMVIWHPEESRYWSILQEVSLAQRVEELGVADHYAKTGFPFSLILWRSRGEKYLWVLV